MTFKLPLIVWVCPKLLSEASNDRLLIHYGDVLELDIESNCKDYVKQVSWEDGEGFKCHHGDIKEVIFYVVYKHKSFYISSFVFG